VDSLAQSFVTAIAPMREDSPPGGRDYAKECSPKAQSSIGLWYRQSSPSMHEGGAALIAILAEFPTHGSSC